MKVSAKDLKAGDVMCVGGQIGEFERLLKGKVVYRPFGVIGTRCRTPRPAGLGQLCAEVRVERNQRWVEVTK